MNYLMLVNKNNRLITNFVPDCLCLVENRKKDKPDQVLMLEKQTLNQFLKMIKSAYQEKDFDIICDSAYRTAEYQQKLYDEQMLAGKDISYVAKPLESEHHTGLCVDVAAYINGEYHDEPEYLEKEYEWLHKNCANFGFILRYPKGKENITGYPYEPWHFRYVGVEHATIIMNKRITLEEYLEDGR